MIRINLLGQIRPKAARRPVDTGAALPVVFIGAGLVLGALVLGFFYYTWSNQLNKENAEIKKLQTQKTDLEQTKLQVEAFEKQKVVLQQRVSTIEQLQRDRTGGQYGVAHGKPMADGNDPPWQHAVASGVFRLGELGGEFHHRSKALRLLPEGRD
jgi:uncharacterized protein HemX